MRWGELTTEDTEPTGEVNVPTLAAKNAARTGHPQCSSVQSQRPHPAAEDATRVGHPRHIQCQGRSVRPLRESRKLRGGDRREQLERPSRERWEGTVKMCGLVGTNWRGCLRLWFALSQR